MIMSIKKIYDEIILVWNESTQSHDTVYEDSYLHDGEIYEMRRNMLDEILDEVDDDGALENKYDKHVFVCINSREAIDKNSCGEKGFEIRTALIKELTLHPDVNIKVRVNKSGCLNECEFGPAIVIYPEGFWYYNVSLSDVSEIIKRSVFGNEYIKRLSRK